MNECLDLPVNVYLMFIAIEVYCSYLRAKKLIETKYLKSRCLFTIHWKWKCLSTIDFKIKCMENPGMVRTNVENVTYAS